LAPLLEIRQIGQKSLDRPKGKQDKIGPSASRRQKPGEAILMLAQFIGPLAGDKANRRKVSGSVEGEAG